MPTNFIHYIVLIFSIFVGSVLDYWWIFWIRTELVIWSLVPHLYKLSDNLVSFVYWQRLGSMIFVLLFIFIKVKLAFFILLFKISLPPFHVWFLTLVKSISWKFLIFFTFLNKIPYIIILSNFWAHALTALLVSFPLIVLGYFWLSVESKYLVWALSISDYPWRYFSSKSFHIILIYLALLTTTVVIILTRKSNVKLVLALLFLSGLPPFRVFQIKIIVIGSLYSFKMYLFMLLTASNHLFLWFYIYLIWFIFNLKTYKKSVLNVIRFILANLLWAFF